MGEKKRGEAKSIEDDGANILSSNTRVPGYSPSKLDDAESAVRLGILRVPGYGSSKLDDAEHGMWLRKLSASQREEYLSKLDDAERAVQLGKLTPYHYHTSNAGRRTPNNPTLAPLPRNSSLSPRLKRPQPSPRPSPSPRLKRLPPSPRPPLHKPSPSPRLKGLPPLPRPSPSPRLNKLPPSPRTADRKTADRHRHSSRDGHCHRQSRRGNRAPAAPAYIAAGCHNSCHRRRQGGRRRCYHSGN